MDTFSKINLLKQLILLFLLGSFSTLTFFVNANPYFKIDLQFSLFIQQFRNDWFFYLMDVITETGNMPTAGLILLVTVGLFFYFNKKIDGIMILLSASSISVVSELLKSLIMRPRPSTSLLLYQLGRYSRSDSYPSGHVLFAIGLYGFLLYLVITKLKKSFLKKILILILSLMLLLMGVSRIYLGAHWFSDVLGSYLIGAFLLYFIILFYNKRTKR